MPGCQRFRLITFIACSLTANAALTLAHNSPYPRAKVTVNDQHQLQLELRCDATAYVLQTTPGHLGDELAGQLEAMTADELRAEIERRQRAFASSIRINADGRFVDVEVAFPSPDVIRQVSQPPGGPAETIQSVITATGAVPKEVKVVTISFPAELGMIILLAGEGETASAEVLPAGQLSMAIPITALRTSTASSNAVPDEQPIEPTSPTTSPSNPSADVPREVIVAGQFAALGFWHIIPEGLDHILFVLGLFLLSTQMKPLLWQITAFTVAHSVTLGLAMFDIVRLPPTVVEPLIAASIAYVAIENLFTTELKPWRPAVVFLFGLLHGLGFASVLTGLGLPEGQFVPALIGFNIGVEFGQLTVVAAALLLVGWFREHRNYRLVVVIPGSLAIAAMGLFWAVERTFFG